MKKLFLLMFPLFIIQCGTKEESKPVNVSKEAQKVKDLNRINDSLDNELNKLQ